MDSAEWNSYDVEMAKSLNQKKDIEKEVELKSVSGLIKELEEIKDKFGDVSLNFCKCKMLSSAVDEKATCYANRIDCLQQGEMCLTYGDLEDAYKEGYNQCIEDMRSMLDVKVHI